MKKKTCSLESRMIRNYHVPSSEGKTYLDVLTPTYDFYWSFRFYCMSPPYGARERYIAGKICSVYGF